MQPDIDEKREFLRVDHEVPLNFKILSGAKLTPKAEVLSRNVSAAGLLFRTTSDSAIPALSSVIWIKLDQKMINICEEIEADLIMINGGVFGRVVRIAEGEPGRSYDIGICFLRRKDMSEEEILSILG